MAYNTSNMAGVKYTDVFTPPSPGDYNYGAEPPFAVGSVSDGTDGSKWVYVEFGTGGVTAAGYSVVIDPETYEAVMMSNSVGALGDPIAVAPAVAALGDFGWVQRFGAADVQVSASAAANVQLASTVTAGQLDDAVGTGTKNITGLVLTTARAASAGTAPGYLNWPTVGSTNA